MFLKKSSQYLVKENTQDKGKLSWNERSIEYTDKKAYHDPGEKKMLAHGPHQGRFNLSH